MEVKIVTIRQALQHVADHPDMNLDKLLDTPAHELISRTLFDIANNAQADSRGTLTKANIARNMIFMRLVGRRRSGSHPATQKKEVDVLIFKPLAGE